MPVNCHRDFSRILTHFWMLDNWLLVGSVLISGYAAGMFVWETVHPSELAGLILENQLPLAQRQSLLAVLGLGILGALLLWPILSWGWALARRIPLYQALKLIASLLLGLTILPFVPILAVRGLETNHPFLVFGIVATMSVLAFFYVRSVGRNFASMPGSVEARQQKEPSDRAGVLTVLIVTVGYVALMSLISVARHNSFMTHAFDLGIQDQVVYNILHSGRMVTTLLGPNERIYDHFSPIFYLIAPIYALHQNAQTLLVLQSVLLGIGALPLYGLARDKTGSTTLAVVLALGYLLYPAVHGANLGDFHQIALVSGLLLSALYFLERRHDRLFFVMLLLALFTKEEVALSVAAIGLYVVLAQGRRRLGWFLTLFGIGYAATIAVAMPKLGSVGPAEFRFADFLVPGKGLFSSLFVTILTNPLYPIVYVIADPGKRIFLFQLFLPLLGLPLLAPPKTWIVALPALLLPLFTAPTANYGINYHYPAHVTPFVFFLAVLALQRLRSKALPTAALASSLVVASLTMTYLYGGIIPKAGLEVPRPNAHTGVIESFLQEIPREGAISTMSDLVPHLTTRKTIYLFPIVSDAEYLLLDTSLHANYWPYEGLKARDRSLRDMLPYIRSGEFGVTRQQDGVILLRRAHDTFGNADAIHKMLSPTYEAEDLRSDFVDSIVDDATASGGRVRFSTPAQRVDNDKAALLYGPYTDLQPGNYRATFFVRASATISDAPLVTIDVFTHKDGYARAVHDLHAGDFTETIGYQAFSLDFNTSGQVLEDVELRVVTHFIADVWVDRVELEYLGQ